MQLANQTRPLSHRSGEELLMLSIGGGRDTRHRINRELNLRALFADCTRRAHYAAIRPRLRLVGLPDSPP